MKKLSTHIVSVNCQVNSQHVVVVVGQMAGWPECAADEWGDIGHLSKPHIIDILKSELLKTICNIIRNHIYPLKTFCHHDGNFFLQICRYVAFDGIDTVDSSVIFHSKMKCSSHFKISQYFLMSTLRVSNVYTKSKWNDIENYATMKCPMFVK